MQNIFATAQPVKSMASKPKKGEKELIGMDDIEQYSHVDAILKGLESVKETLAATIKAKALGMFIERAKGRKPESFRAAEGDASASIEMRKRSTRSALTDEEVIVLEQLNIPVETSITVPRMFGINPSYCGDMKLLEKVSAAIAALVPADFIVVQEEKSTRVVSDSTFDEAWKQGVSAEVVSMVGVIAIKPKLETTDIATLLQDARKHFLTDEQLAAEEEQKKLVAAVLATKNKKK